MGVCNKKSLANENAVHRISRVSQGSIMLSANDALFDKPAVQSSKVEVLSKNWARRGSALLPQQIPKLLSRRGSDLNLNKLSSLQPDQANLKRRASVSHIVTKTESDMHLIKSALQKHFIFSNLPEVQIETIAKEMQLFVYPGESLIFEQNSIGEHFYIISRGKVEVIINLKVVAFLSVGDSFGEVALLHDTPRTASIISVQETSLWGLDRAAFRSILQTMSVAKYSENLGFVEIIPIFKSLTKKQKEALANALMTETYKSGDRILREGDFGDFMFVLKEGNVIVTKNGSEIRKLGKGDYFGEQALLKDNIRTASITALDKVTCLSINSSGLHSVLGNHLQEVIHLNTQRIAIDADLKLNQLFPAQINEVISKAKIISYKRGTPVRPAGGLIGGLIIILKGSIGSKFKKFNALNIIGVHVLTDGDTPLLENLTAIEDTDVAEISKADIEQALSGKLIETIERNQVFKVIKNIGIFRAIETKTLERLVKMLNLVYFRGRSYVFMEGSQGDAFFIVKSGSVEVLKNNQLVRIISKLDYFGERSLIFNKTRTASVRAVDDVECWTLTKSQFNRIFDEIMKNHLLQRIAIQDTPVEYSDLSPISEIYQGKISKIVLCASQVNSKLYVIKSMYKTRILAQNLQTTIVNQKKIMSQLDHIFIIKLIKTFKDQTRLAFLTEYIPGAEFGTSLRAFKKIDELDARFYIACIILILEYLHDHDIIYRDINTRNFMVDELGYLKLIDFSCAKYLQGKTFSLLGTPHFLAPEVISGQGYGLAADLWSLGVLLYFCLYGIYPFGNNLSDPMEIYQDINNKRLNFPSNVDPLSKSRDFLSILLNRNPSQRGDVAKLKQHPWFVGLNWDYLVTKQIKAPYLPVCKDFKEEIHDVVKSKRTMEEVLPCFENFDKYIPRFQVNSKWDAEF